MKCLEKDRNRRYETANDVAIDVQRYLHDEAVKACPPSTAYRVPNWLDDTRAPTDHGRNRRGVDEYRHDSGDQ